MHSSPNTISNSIPSKHSISGALSQSDNQFLGITTEFASTTGNIGIESKPRHEQLASTLQNNINKYELQRIAQKIMVGHRIGACMRTIAPTATEVELHYNPDKNHAHYRNLMRCDNVWLCPVCSSRMTSERAEDIRKAYSYAVSELKYKVVMVTYTMSHRNFDSLQSNVNDLREARRKMRSGRKWQEFKQNYGYEHCISSLETPYNELNGWHVHVHELMFLNPDKAEFELHENSKILDDWLGQELSGQWIKALNKVGRSASWEHGINVTSANQRIAEYISKHGKLPFDETWDLSMELTKNMSKKSHDSLHPFQILARAEDDYKYRKLWVEYALAFDGKAQIFWTKGLKELCLLPEEEISQEEEEVKEETFVMSISQEDWRTIVLCKAQGRLLNFAILSQANIAEIEKWIKFHTDYINHWKKKKALEKCMD